MGGEMNKEKVISTLHIIGIIIMVVFVLTFLILGAYKGEQNKKLCYANLGEDYSFWATNTKLIEYEFIDETYYNCCWSETELTNNGYYTAKRCKGYEK